MGKLLTEETLNKIVEQLKNNEIDILDLKSDICDEEATVGDNEAIILADALKYNTSLKKLDISCNIVSTEGAEAFANALRVNRTLIEFNISSN